MHECCEQLSRLERKLDQALQLLRAMATESFIHNQTVKLQTKTNQLAAAVAANQPEGVSHGESDS